LGDGLVEGVSEWDVADESIFEECEWAYALGTVDYLVWEDEVAGFDRFLETADCGEGDDGSDAY
jgi:hypothetical protein